MQEAGQADTFKRWQRSLVSGPSWSGWHCTESIRVHFVPRATVLNPVLLPAVAQDGIFHLDLSHPSQSQLGLVPDIVDTLGMSGDMS